MFLLPVRYRMLVRPNWGRIWAWLSLPQRVALVEVCRGLDIPYERWHEVPALALTYRTSALLSLMRRTGISYNAAGEKACKELGLNWPTERRRLVKWRSKLWRKG